VNGQQSLATQNCHTTNTLYQYDKQTNNLRRRIKSCNKIENAHTRGPQTTVSRETSRCSIHQCIRALVIVLPCYGVLEIVGVIIIIIIIPPLQLSANSISLKIPNATSDLTF